MKSLILAAVLSSVALSAMAPAHAAGFGLLKLKLKPGASVMLNPQPIPPKESDLVMLNPQPLPPKESGLVMLNPQPLPPKESGVLMLNPQPLPPKESFAGFSF